MRTAAGAGNLGQTTTILKIDMEEYGSETDSDYTSYWRDWVS